MRFLALTFQEGHSRTDIARFLKVSRTKCQQMGEQLLATRRGGGWIVSVHQADPPSSAPNSYPSLANISTNKAGWPSGDDCKVLIFKRIYRDESLVWPMNSPMSTASSESWGFPG